MTKAKKREKRSQKQEANQVLGGLSEYRRDSAYELRGASVSERWEYAGLEAMASVSIPQRLQHRENIEDHRGLAVVDNRPAFDKATSKVGFQRR